MTLLISTILYFSVFFIHFPESTTDPTFNEIIYGVLCELLVVVLFFGNFIKTDYKKSVEKAGWFCLLLWSVLNIIFFTWFGYTCIINYIIGFIELIIFFSLFCYSQFRSFNYNGDEYDPNCNYLVFKKPCDLWGFLFSCIFTPISSVSVVTEGTRYGYRMNFPFEDRKYKNKDSHILVKIDVDSELIKSTMEPMIGAKWNPVSNCCSAMHSLFPNIKFNALLDRLPCYMINTIIEYKDSNAKRSERN